MGDAYGPMPLPAAAWGGAGTTLADPALDTLSSFFAAVINDQGSVAWASVFGAGQKPVAATFTYNPEEGGFNEQTTPALYLWRSKFWPSEWVMTDYFIRRTSITMLWIPPSAVQEFRAVATGFRNLVASAVDGVLAPDARTPSWKQQGDTDPLSATQGSLLWTYAQLVYRLLAGPVEPVSIKLTADKQYPALRVMLDLWEQNTSHQDPSDSASVDGLDETIAADGTSGTLTWASLTYKLTLASISPTSGTHLGGTAVTLRGTGIQPKATVTIGGVALQPTTSSDGDTSSVFIYDGATVLGLSPAHATGAADVVVTNPNGETATLAGAFTFT